MCDENKKLRAERDYPGRVMSTDDPMGYEFNIRTGELQGQGSVSSKPAVFSVDKTREGLDVAQRIRVAIEGVPLRVASRALDVVRVEVDVQQGLYGR